MYDITDSRETITSGCNSRNSRLNLREKQKMSTTSGQRKNNTLKQILFLTQNQFLKVKHRKTIEQTDGEKQISLSQPLRSGEIAPKPQEHVTIPNSRTNKLVQRKTNTSHLHYNCRLNYIKTWSYHSPVYIKIRSKFFSCDNTTIRCYVLPNLHIKFKKFE